ncbi:MAG: DNA-formamidopyrimidine glycosylase [Acholeplasmataceae bacterium]|nr:DNA-formamidopyrimidine glycosylase [Acholeplasmataceae bacterium]
MPELPEVETVRRTLLLKLKDKKILNVDVLYTNIIKTDLNTFKRNVVNQTIKDIQRMGKYLIFILDQDVMIMHLRMEGKFFIKTKEAIDKHEHIIFNLSDHLSLRYHDVRKFGTLHFLPKDQYLSLYPLNKLGLEPKDKDIVEFYKQIHHTHRPIKAVLLDQNIISGLGNIYVDETLFLAKIHPTKIASKVTKKQAQLLLESATKVLDKAVELGGTTIRSYTSSLGVHGRFQNELNVHTKQGQPCPICGKDIIKIKVAGRGSYVCPNCQK